MNFTQRFLGYSAATALVFYLINLSFPKDLVFGNIILGPVAALIVSALLIGFLVTWAGEHIKKYSYKDAQGLLVYWVVNSVAIYLVARTPISEIVAIGVRAFWVAIAVGFVTNLAQYALWKALPSRKK